LSTNIIEQDKTPQALIYPNPGSDELQIQVSQGVQSIIVLDLQGRVVLSQEGKQSQKVSIDTSTLPAGTYIIREVGDDMIPWPKATNQRELMIRAEDILTIADPTEEVIAKYLELTGE
jgi:hypothetical protein